MHTGAGERTRTFMLSHMGLNHTCLPIPPHPHIGAVYGIRNHTFSLEG